MGIGTLGFLSGASRTALDSISKREEADREEKKAKLIAQLNLDNSITLKGIDRKYDLEDADTKITSWVKGDGDSYQGLNNKGEVKTVRKMSAGELKDAQDEAKKTALSLQKAEIDIENTRDTIRSRGADDARQNRVATAQIGSYNRSNQPTALDGSSDGMAGTSERAMALIEQNKPLIESLKSQGVSRVMAENLATKLVLEAKAKQKMGTPIDLNSTYNAALMKLIDAANSRVGGKRPAWSLDDNQRGLSQ